MFEIENLITIITYFVFVVRKPVYQLVDPVMLKPTSLPAEVISIIGILQPRGLRIILPSKQTAYAPTKLRRCAGRSVFL